MNKITEASCVKCGKKGKMFLINEKYYCANCKRLVVEQSTVIGNNRIAQQTTVYNHNQPNFGGFRPNYGGFLQNIGGCQPNIMVSQPNICQHNGCNNVIGQNQMFCQHHRCNCGADKNFNSIHCNNCAQLQQQALNAQQMYVQQQMFVPQQQMFGFQQFEEDTETLIKLALLQKFL